MEIKWHVPVYVAVMEILFHLEVFGQPDINMIHGIFFSLPFSAFLLLLGSTKWDKWNAGIRMLGLFFFLLYFSAQLIYHEVFGNFLSLKSVVNGAGQAMDFGATIGEAFAQHALVLCAGITGWLFCLVTEVLKGKREPEIKKNRKVLLWYAVFWLALPFLGTLLLMKEGTELNGAYEVKLSFHRTEQSMYKLGLTETLVKDVRETLCENAGITERQINGGYLWIAECFAGKPEAKEEMVVPVSSGIPEDGAETEENKDGEEAGRQEEGEQQEVRTHRWEIDFTRLSADTTDEELKDMHAYFSGVEATPENAYTGLFAGYNLIYITAESFSDVVLDKERTPALYRMWKEGFQFANFYTPSWYLSTIDGEYVNCLGQIPMDGDWSMEHAAGNALPLALGNQLKARGYVCNAYHNHDSYYYDRTKTHPALGYTFQAAGAGLHFESMYPESDLELMEITAKEYLHQAPFHTYYVTMSGHLPYTYDYNSMAVKNRETIEALGLSENASCYLAANMELEYGVEYLVEELERAGQLEKTLFVIAADHYPYGLKRGAYDELQGMNVEQDVFELYRNTCLIWSASMKEMKEISFPVTVKKFGSNLDLLPTISNLMGLSYDSRLLAGKDLLSEETGLVMFKDQSFLTDRVRYNARTGEAVWVEGEEEDKAYLQQCMNTVKNRFYYSAQILKQDYFRIVEESRKDKE